VATQGDDPNYDAVVARDADKLRVTRYIRVCSLKREREEKKANEAAHTAQYRPRSGQQRYGMLISEDDM
jgi:hypothetical protein